MLYSSITGLHLGQYFQNLPITENEKMKNLDLYLTLALVAAMPALAYLLGGSA